MLAFLLFFSFGFIELPAFLSGSEFFVGVIVDLLDWNVQIFFFDWIYWAPGLVS